MSDDDKPRRLQTLGHYDPPLMPTDESLRRFSWKIWKHWRSKDEDPFISDDSLHSANRRKLDAIVAPPACGPILDELQATFADWIADASPARWLQLVVLPPGDPHDVLRTWAGEQGHRIIEPPPRTSLLAPLADVPDLVSDQGDVLVIPRLERWFLRHFEGLHNVRRLLESAAEAQRHCVIGCNSWAWQFLGKSIGAELLLPLGLTFEAFNAVRLREWFKDLATDEENEGRTFRFSASGREVFPADSQSVEASQFFQKLAATSNGIPWIAWRLWRRSLWFGPNDDQRGEDFPIEKFPNEKTIWVAPLEQMRLPSTDVDASLLSLHALLIHDGLTAGELDKATPSVDASNVLPSLVAADFVCRDGDRYSCVPAAYPVIRAALQDAGFPMDRL